ncbi:MAG TPA: DUF721 domain-containing protein, partial [Candidatus Obscuribacterales bacterium]
MSTSDSARAPGRQPSQQSQASTGPPGQDVQERRGGAARNFQRVDRILNRVVAALDLERRLRERTFISLWPSLVGEPWAQKSRCLFLDAEGNLVVALADAATGQELSLMKPAILARLISAGRSIGVAVKGIRFDLKHYHESASDSRQPDGQAAARLPEPSDEDLAAVELTLDERRQVEELAAGVAATHGTVVAPERMAALFERQLRRRRWRRL